MSAYIVYRILKLKNVYLYEKFEMIMCIEVKILIERSHHLNTTLTNFTCI